MKEGPDIAKIGALIGDPARANMLTALMSGKALTVSELAQEAGVGLSTASSHLTKLQDGGLLSQAKQGRHRYFTLAGPEVGEVLEALMGLAAHQGHLRTRTGPKDPALRAARVCYDHLAGDMAVRIFDSLSQRDFVSLDAETSQIALTRDGEAFVERLRIDLHPLKKGRRPVCLTCLDWSERRNHLAGALGAALLTRFQDLGWARREKASRIVHISPVGQQELLKVFPIV
ncbi:regulatory protein ArsR [Roseibium sp. TrichSKD4]|uniref:ArsR/SmtB family transcription factor n=1 Tax=Roseibium sp. TrichSKD4 TaxID=744980 RepID=UPI0001E57154|nr:winged helix-turn-helix domain-containing protein [Roseibium sp. TrichSKD4]EFO28960.1 regulatory protein ArsR [Roseibium sp. TrichSKD4]